MRGRLYIVVEPLTQNFRLLLLVLSLEYPQKRKVSSCNVQFGGIAHYGKKPAKS